MLAGVCWAHYLILVWSSIDVSEKDEMRELAMRGGRYSSDEIVQLLDYCQSDVDALVRLLPEMAPMIDLPRALLRGRYMAAVAQDGKPSGPDRRVTRCGPSATIGILSRIH